MDYREIGEQFCSEINQILKFNKYNASFVTGGGYAYDSIKYEKSNVKGDFDFMIVYDEYATVQNIILKLKNTNFDFESKYLDTDLELMHSNKIDIIRLSGDFKGIKSTINLVPISLVKKVCDFEQKVIIKKIAHNRNTSLFYAYGSDCSRIIVNFISPSFVTPDKEDHYIHLDFSHIEHNNNIYLGILADAILKGFNKNYDALNFSNLRDIFLDNIHNFFTKNNINSSLIINLFANNRYFPQYLKDQLISEFEKRGKISGEVKTLCTSEPIIFTTSFESNYPVIPFNFINNKPYKTSFYNYIKTMQDTEYDRQYLIDALGKFYGYIQYCEFNSEKQDYMDDDIISKIDVYGTNDLYMENITKYKIESIVDSFIKSLLKNKENYNEELIKNFLMISTKFLEIITHMDLSKILELYNISNLFDMQLDNNSMNIDTILKVNSFNEIGTYHNYVSKVMPVYTEKECQFLDYMFNGQRDKKILDIMCGYGRIANKMKEYGYKKIYGIDNEAYKFINMNKDFTFIEDDYLKHEFKQLFDFAYSLYNCYDSNENLYKIMDKTYSLLCDDGLFVIDCFNKEWRDTIDRHFEKTLYHDNDYKLTINRDYNQNNGIEKTWYNLIYHRKKIKEYDYCQKFFTKKDILNIINNKWDYEILNSEKLQSRTNSQKHILVLRKK